MKKWFEKWSAEKARRKEKNLPAVVEYRDETYVSSFVGKTAWSLTNHAVVMTLTILYHQISFVATSNACTDHLHLPL